MDLYLAGTYSRIYVHESWMSTLLEKMGNPVSLQKFIGGGYGNISRGRYIRESLSSMEENSNRGGENNEHLFGWGASSKEWQTSHRGGQKILESFFYARDNQTIQRLIPYLGGFLLDSGAFSFLQGKTRTDWDKYTEDYADFINRFGIELFFELDIDSIIGINEVERLRAKLERLTGKQPIPVWHKGRGKDYFLGMVKDYPYVALGGIAIKEIPLNIFEKAFPWFINKAHENGAKIHGLGYTSITGIHKYHFDSVDSTAWLYGNRGGYLYKFNPRTGEMDKIDTPKGFRLKSQDAARWNFNEWVKFQKYAERYL